MMLVRCSMFFALCASVALPAFAQHADGYSTQGGMQMPMPVPSGESPAIAMPENPLGINHTRDASGTSWLPDASPMQGLMRSRGTWTLMLHGNAFLEFIKTGSDRGDDQFGSINWIMGMAQRPFGGGSLLFKTMISLEPITVGKCGYPALLQTGEVCNGAPLHDRQHPHDLFMEIAADYRRALSESIAFELYGGPAAEPALGPTAYAHRLSALPDPIAPISHHWIDSTHVSFGVLTGGVYGRKWKAEASLFNGREPDDRRYDFDFGRLDSYSGRFWFLPASQWSLQVSAGHLEEGEIRDAVREDVDRVTASATYHRLVNGRIWATTVAWGQNHEMDHSTSAFTAETAVDVTRSDTLFGRGEVVGKAATDLVLPLPDRETFVLTKLQAGYTRWILDTNGLQAGVGASVGVSIVPEDLRPYYGGRAAGDFAVFLTARPH
jgi:hypothetical protein